MSRALAAGVGSSTTLLAAAATVLVIAGAIVAFRGDGLVGVFDHATPLVVDDAPGAGAPGDAQPATGSSSQAAALDRAARARRERAGSRSASTVAGRPRPDGIRHAFAGQPTTPGSAPQPTAKPAPSRSGASPGGSDRAPSSSPGKGGSGGGSGSGGGGASTTPTAPSLGSTVQTVTDAAGQTVSGVTHQVADPLAPASPPLADTVSGIGDTAGQTTSEAGKVVGSLLGSG